MVMDVDEQIEMLSYIWDSGWRETHLQEENFSFFMSDYQNNPERLQLLFYSCLINKSELLFSHCRGGTFKNQNEHFFLCVILMHESVQVPSEEDVPGSRVTQQIYHTQLWGHLSHQPHRHFLIIDTGSKLIPLYGHTINSRNKTYAINYRDPFRIPTVGFKAWFEGKLQNSAPC